MHNAQRMLQSAMCSPWIHHVRPSKLSNASQPLKRIMIDNIMLPVAVGYEPVHRVSNLVSPYGEHQRQSNPQIALMFG